MAALRPANGAAIPTAPAPDAVLRPQGGSAAQLPPSLLEGCRFASLQLGGPRLTSLGVVSSIRGEGRSSVALALARIQAEDYERAVVLVDLDLERPGLSTRLGTAVCPGVAELAAGTASVEAALQPLAERSAFVAAGATEGSLARTMATIVRSGVLGVLGERFDVVIADLPPLLGSGLGQAPAELFADLLLVVRAGVTPVPRIREATAHLPSPPTVLLNGTRSHLPAWLRHLLAC